MKKRILLILFVMFVVLTVNGQDYNNNYDNYEYTNQEYDNDYYDSESDNNQEYYYDYENILPNISQYESIYYWEHPYRIVNFVIIGSRVYIIPRSRFYNIYNRYRFHHVSMERFITLSCFGMPYYDNYYRFSLYSDYFRNNYYSSNNFGRYWYRGVRNHYRRYYSNRRSNSKYRNLKSRYITRRGDRSLSYNKKITQDISRSNVNRNRNIVKSRSIKNYGNRQSQQRENNVYKSNKRVNSSVKSNITQSRSVKNSENRRSSLKSSNSNRIVSNNRNSAKRSISGGKRKR